MSENCRYYVNKMVERRIRLVESSLVRTHFKELLETVSRCEAMWTLESRIEASR